MEAKKIAETLTSFERKVLPLVKANTPVPEIIRKSGLSEIEVMRALQWLGNKKLVELEKESQSVITLGKNGQEYVKRGLPEKSFVKALDNKKLNKDELRKKAGLDEAEMNACVGLLKQRGIIKIEPGMNISLTSLGKDFIAKKTLEESLLEKIKKHKVRIDELKPEEKFAFENLKKRKEIIAIKEEKLITATITENGQRVLKQKIPEKLIDTLAPETLKKGDWKNRKFRRYDVTINVPKISGGKKHFVKQAISYAKRIWTDLGFREMEGPIINTSFWNFDALFTPQDHPARDLQDTFFIKSPSNGKLPGKALVNSVKKAHEAGVCKSKGWQYKWDEEKARRNVLRTHTSVLSSRTIAELKKSDLPAKFFAVGRCFRNEAVDWKHLFEFNQTEGIVVDPDANFRHLLGYLKEFFKKMGFPKARFRPAHFPYTEPSLEIEVFHPVHNEWVELGGAGMFRPEVVCPLLGEDVKVLAWGPGFDRIMMDYYKIKDLRDLYSNNLEQIRNMKFWNK